MGMSTMCVAHTRKQRCRKIPTNSLSIASPNPYPKLTQNHRESEPAGKDTGSSKLKSEGCRWAWRCWHMHAVSLWCTLGTVYTRRRATHLQPWDSGTGGRIRNFSVIFWAEGQPGMYMWIHETLLKKEKQREKVKKKTVETWTVRKIISLIKGC